MDRSDTTAAGGAGGSHGSDLSARLQAELERLLETENPFEALGVGFEATSAQIRTSFLTLTKKYHPSRFARMDRSVVKLANEVFLRVKDAYGTLRVETTRMKALETFGPKPEKPAPPKTATPKDPDTARPTKRSIARGTPSSKRGAPINRPKRPTPSRQTGSQRAQEIAATANSTVRRRTEDYEMALKMIVEGRYKDARTLFHKVAAEDPKTKKYRVQMHYSWGLEHEDGGKFDEARKEFERALGIDPEFKRAHEALDRLPRDKKGSGFFSKIFGR